MHNDAVAVASGDTPIIASYFMSCEFMSVPPGRRSFRSRSLEQSLGRVARSDLRYPLPSYHDDVEVFAARTPVAVSRLRVRRNEVQGTTRLPPAVPLR